MVEDDGNIRKTSTTKGSRTRLRRGTKGYVDNEELVDEGSAGDDDFVDFGDEDGDGDPSATDEDDDDDGVVDAKDFDRDNDGVVDFARRGGHR